LETGKEKVYKNEKHGNVTLLNGKDKSNVYILIDDFPTDDEKLNAYMLSHKEELISRKIRKFNERNWYEWGALRNFANIQKNMGKPCIYIYNMSRNKEIAFVDKVQYFGGNLLMLIPNKSIDLKKIIEYMNTDSFKNNYMYSGRFKIGHRQISNCLLDFTKFI